MQRRDFLKRAVAGAAAIGAGGAAVGAKSAYAYDQLGNLGHPTSGKSLAMDLDILHHMKHGPTTHGLVVVREDNEKLTYLVWRRLEQSTRPPYRIHETWDDVPALDTSTREALLKMSRLPYVPDPQ